METLCEHEIDRKACKIFLENLLSDIKKGKTEQRSVISQYMPTIGEDSLEAVAYFLSQTKDVFIFRDLDAKLGTLRIEPLPFISSFVFRITGYYDIKTHKIKVVDQSHPDIYHELFHAMSSYRVSQRELGCGFFQASKGIKEGLMLDEGYTDLLTYRYFHSPIFYHVGANLAQKIELMLTQDLMQVMYGLNDSESIYRFLSNNSTTISTEKFKILFDKIGYYKKIDRNIINIFNYLSDYLVEVYINYLSKQYQLGTLDRPKVIEFLDNFKRHFTEHVFADEDDEMYYCDSSEYRDINMKLSYSYFQKTLLSKPKH